MIRWKHTAKQSALRTDYLETIPLGDGSQFSMPS
jgi:hypothetical protein